jgi:predicted nucleotidyltransferase
MRNFVIAPGQVVKRVLITKSDSNDYDVMQLECTLVFEDDSEIEYIIGHPWSITEDKYLYCELEDDKYPFGIYEYKDNEYITIENWEE